MPQVSLDNGDVEGLVTLDRFDAVQIQPSGGDVRFDENRASARRGQIVEDGEIATEVALKSNETLYVASEADGVTVDYRKQGFLDFRFPQANINVQRKSSEGVTEVDADINTTIGPGESATSTVQASAGELWTVEKLEIVVDTSNNDDGTVTATVQTEAEAIELGFAQGSSTVTEVLYRSGQWDSTSANLDGSRGADNIPGTQIDDTNGISVVIANNSSNDTIPSGTEVSWQFSVVDI